MLKIDSLGRKRKRSQGGAGPKALPKASGGKLTGDLTDSPPPHLGKPGKEFWAQAAEAMRKLGILESADRHILELAASSYQRIADARADIKRHGRLVDAGKGPKRNPAFVTLEKAEASLHSRLSDLGLTPSARAKFAPAKEVTDPFDAIFAQAS